MLPSVNTLYNNKVLKYLAFDVVVAAVAAVVIIVGSVERGHQAQLQTVPGRFDGSYDLISIHIHVINRL